MKKKITAIVVLTSLLLGILPSVAMADLIKEKTPNINAVSYIVLEQSSGEVILGQNYDAQYTPGDLVQMMTAVLAIESGKLSDTVNPQGVVSICAIPKFDKLDNSGLYLALEKTADPSNLGAIARSAEAFGVKGIYISSESCDPYSPKSLRAGMGALLRLPIIVCEDILSTCKELKLGGASLYASVVSGDALDVKDLTPSEYSVLLIGNEANGLSSDIVDISEKVTIKMQGRAESLNASAAAAVLIWEFLRG